MKQKIWPVFEEYRAQLNARGLKEMTDAVREMLASFYKTKGIYCLIRPLLWMKRRIWGGNFSN